MAGLLRAGDVMSPNLATVTEHMTLDHLARFFVERKISGAPVLDGEGRLTGVVTTTDLARAVAETSTVQADDVSVYYRNADDAETLEDLGQRYVEQQSLTVRELMNHRIHHVPETATVPEVARIMVERRIHRLIVTRDERPVGIISSMDVLRIVAGQPSAEPAPR